MHGIVDTGRDHHRGGHDVGATHGHPKDVVGGGDKLAITLKFISHTSAQGHLVVLSGGVCVGWERDRAREIERFIYAK